MESTTLYFREGSSDKVYRAELAEQNGGWTVRFAYGRRGTALTTGIKTTQPVSSEEARRIYDKLIREKTAKGYGVGENTGAHQPTVEKQASGIRCQLLNPIEETQLDRFMEDPAYWAQEKHDGRRLLLWKQDRKVTGINKLGFEIPVAKALETSALAFDHDFLLDGELIDDTLMAFDLLEIDGWDIRFRGYAERSHQLLTLLASRLSSRIRMVHSSFLSVQKRQLHEQLQKDGKEGIVFKRFDALYFPGRPATGGSQFKYKFCASASCLVSRVNPKRSVGLKVIDGDHTVQIGNVTIPANFEVPPVGTVVEVRYLYAFRGGSLFQPVYLGRRDDVSPLECVVAQLKFKSEPEQEAA